MSQDVARLGARSNESGLKRTSVSYIAPSSFIELMSVSWPGSSDVGSATRPITNVPGAAAAFDAGAALPTGASRVGAATRSTTPAPSVWTKRGRESPIVARRRDAGDPMADPLIGFLTSPLRDIWPWQGCVKPHKCSLGRGDP